MQLRLPSRRQWLVAVCAIISTGCESPSPSAMPGMTDVADRHSAASQSSEQLVEGTPVTVMVRLADAAPRPGETTELSVELRIAPLWEVRTLDAQPALTATRLELTLPDVVDTDGDWQAPEPGRSMASDGHPVYVDSTTFRRSLKVSPHAVQGEYQIACTVGYQACNERQCLAPQTVDVVIPLRIAAH